MTIPRPTPFLAITPRARVFTPFVIISDSDGEIPVRPAPPSPDHTPALYGYPLDSGDDSLDEDLSETDESLHTQTALTLVVHPPPTQSLSTSPVLANQPGKDIPMPKQSPLSPLLPPSKPPPPGHIESVGDNIEASIRNLERHLGP
ncbi:hypothetical protein Tco_0482443 [Tanacetum coccineum]